MAVIDTVIENAKEWVDKKSKYMIETFADIKKTVNKIEESLKTNDKDLGSQLGTLKFLNDSFAEFFIEYNACKDMLRMLEYNKREAGKNAKELTGN